MSLQSLVRLAKIEVNVEIGRDMLVNVGEELQEFLVAMAGFALGEDLARGEFQCRE